VPSDRVKGALDLTDPDLVDIQLMRGAYAVRLPFGAILAVAVFAFPGLMMREKVVISALFLFIYIPQALAVSTNADRLRSSAAHFAVALTDLLTMFTFAVVVPDTRVMSLFGYQAIVGIQSSLSGLMGGLATTACAVGLMLAAELRAPVADRLSPYTLVVFPLVMIVISVGSAATTTERRRAARFLARLTRAVRAVATSAEPAETLCVVTTGAKEAVDASFVALLLREGDRLVLAAIDGFGTRVGYDASERQRREAVANADAGPSAVAMATGQPVVVDDFDTDERFSQWAETAKTHGFRSMVSIPLPVEDHRVGVLNAYFAQQRGATDDDVSLLVAYAEQAALAIARTQAYEHERQAVVRLEEADALKSEFIATVSHELRTPLHIVEGFLETVLARWDDFPDSERRQLLDRVAHNARELDRLIAQLLDFSRVDANRVSVSPRPCDLASEVGEIVGRLAAVLSHHEVVVDVAQAVSVFVDPAALEHIVGNLLTNAAKFSDRGSRIEISGEVHDGEALVRVRDHGIGVAPEDQDRIFEPFVQGPFQIPGRRGTGVGLAIVSRYIELSDGRIEVSSLPGEGACFVVALPLVARDRGRPVPASLASA
jgi:signal transduction histidine kinase